MQRKIISEQAYPEAPFRTSITIFYVIESFEKNLCPESQISNMIISTHLANVGVGMSLQERHVTTYFRADIPLNGDAKSIILHQSHIACEAYIMPCLDIILESCSNENVKMGLSPSRIRFIFCVSSHWRL